MPPRKRATKAVSDEFIDDGDEDAPKTKRTKTKTSVATNNTQKQTDDEGNTFWELGGKLRRVTVSKFRGSVFVNIREHYEKDGKVLPGKKGISLSIEQFNAMMNILPQLHENLSKESESAIVIPDFGAASGMGKSGNTNAKDEDLEEDEEIQSKKPATKAKKEQKTKPKSAGSDSEEEEEY